MLELMLSLGIGVANATSREERLDAVETLARRSGCEFALDDRLVALSPREAEYAALVERRLTAPLSRPENAELFGEAVWSDAAERAAHDQVSAVLRSLMDDYVPWTEEYFSADRTNLGEMMRLRPVRMLLVLFQSSTRASSKFTNAEGVRIVARRFARLFVPISRELLAHPPKTFGGLAKNLDLFARVAGEFGFGVPAEWPAVAYWSEHLDVINAATDNWRAHFGFELDDEPGLVKRAPDLELLVARLKNDVEYVTSLHHRVIDLPRLRNLFERGGPLTFTESLAAYVPRGTLELSPLVWENVLADVLKFHALDWIVGEVVRDVAREFDDHLGATMVRLHPHWREAARPRLMDAFEDTWNPKEALETYRARRATYEAWLDARAHNEARIARLEAADLRAFGLFDRRSNHRRAFVAYLAQSHPRAFSEPSVAGQIAFETANRVWDHLPDYAIDLHEEYREWSRRQTTADTTLAPSFREWTKFAFLTLAASDAVVARTRLASPKTEWRPELVSRRDRRYFK